VDKSQQRVVALTTLSLLMPASEYSIPVQGVGLYALNESFINHSNAVNTLYADVEISSPLVIIHLLTNDTECTSRHRKSDPLPTQLLHNCHWLGLHRSIYKSASLSTGRASSSSSRLQGGTVVCGTRAAQPLIVNARAELNFFHRRPKHRVRKKSLQYSTHNFNKFRHTS